MGRARHGRHCRVGAVTDDTTEGLHGVEAAGSTGAKSPHLTTYRLLLTCRPPATQTQVEQRLRHARTTNYHRRPLGPCLSHPSVAAMAGHIGITETRSIRRHRRAVHRLPDDGQSDRSPIRYRTALSNSHPPPSAILRTSASSLERPDPQARGLPHGTRTSMLGVRGPSRRTRSATSPTGRRPSSIDSRTQSPAQLLSHLRPLEHDPPHG